MTTTDRADATSRTPSGPAPRGIELNGLNTIDESERKGRPRDLFWPWFGANVSVFGISYGSFLLGFGVSFLQATVVGLVGIVFSFLLCGFVALAGKRGSAPTMVLSRAAFGVRGNRLPSLLSWLLTVGWETALTSLAVLSTATVFDRLGAGGGVGTKLVALVVVAALIVAAGVAGFDVIMRLQRVITLVTGVLTVIYVLLVLGDIDLTAVAALPSGSAPAVVGGLVFMMTGFGLGWVNAAADYSRYLPRRASSRGVVGWTTFGSSLAPVLLLLFGLLLAGSSPQLSDAIAVRPDRRPDHPAAHLVPRAVRPGRRARPRRRRRARHLLLGSGPAQRRGPHPALRRGGRRRGADDRRGRLRRLLRHRLHRPFPGLPDHARRPGRRLVRRGLADVALRRRDYVEADLYDPRGRYGDVRWLPIVLVVVATALGWGLVTNASASWLLWQGYLLGPLGGREGGERRLARWMPCPLMIIRASQTRPKPTQRPVDICSWK